ncbi:MAG: platelet-activating factor acetylhydrolase IB subunit [Pirellulaceae bacterium]
MKLRWVWCGALLVSVFCFVPAALGQRQLESIQAVQPEVQPAEWWSKRHQEKLEEKKSRGQIDLLMIGDSITHGWEDGGKAIFEKYYAHRKALNLGFSGDRTEQVIWRLRHGAIEGISPRLAVIMIGTNNAGHRKEKPEETAAGVKAILEELHTQLPETKCLVLAIFPRGETAEDPLRQLNTATNQILEGYADGRRVFFLNINDRFLEADDKLSKSIMPDFLHPNEKGYAIWAEAMEPTVEKLLE